ncbi:MAG: hypothetical protein ACE14P_00335 [Methanotrichaceae archaeon]
MTRTIVESLFERKYLLLVFIFLTALFTIRFMVVGYGVGGDGIGYYAYLPSLIIDHDLDFENQYLSSPWINSSNKFMDKSAAVSLMGDRLSKLTPEGYVSNPYPIGSAVLWLPFFILSLILTSFLNLLGFNFPMNGYSVISQYVTLIGSIVYAVAGLLLANRLIGNFGIKQKAIVLSMGFILVGTFAIQYLAVEPSMSHANDFFIVTLFFYFFYNYFILTDNKTTHANWILFGLICGLMAIVRQQNVVFLILPAINYLSTLASEKEPLQIVVKRESINLLLFGVSFSVSLLPQLLSWKVLYGSFITIPQGRDYLHFSSPQILTLLFSFNHGLLTSSPILIFSLIGLILLLKNYKKDKSSAHNRLLVFLSLAFLSQVYINSVIVDVWGGDSFGSRRFAGLILVFILGLAYFIDYIDDKKFKNAVYVILTALVALNLIYFMEYNLLIIPRFGEVTYLDLISNLFKLLRIS